MRCKLWNRLLLLSPALLCGVGALAQYNPPATPAPYNPIALADVTGAPRQPFKPARATIKPCRRIRTSEEFLGGNSAQRRWRFHSTPPSP